MNEATGHGPSPARRTAATALASAAAAYPDLPPLELETRELSPRDARLARALWRTVLRRWITLDFVLDRHLRRPSHTLEPSLRGVLLAGAGALLFLDRQPPHAVVDASVALARSMVRPAAAGLVNAVLRRVAAGVAGRRPDVAWSPHPSHLPDAVGVCELTEPILPDPAAGWDEHVALATSHPVTLVTRWRRAYGEAGTLRLCTHGLKTAPVILAVGESADGDATLGAHRQPGFAVWEGGTGTLPAFLACHPETRVQDPTAALPLAAATVEGARVILDYCAGMGTKTHQALHRFPDAHIVAHEVDSPRRRRLTDRFVAHDRVVVTGDEAALDRHLPGPVDLLLLDVPCSNSAVLARRPEARYRYTRRNVKSLRALQRRIAERALPRLRPGGELIYATCSLDPDENEAQVKWLIDTCGLTLVDEVTTQPQGTGADYCDGGYHACLRKQAGDEVGDGASSP